MHVIETDCLTPQQKAVVYRLWNQEYPGQVSHKTPADLDAYLGQLSEVNHYLLQGDGEEVEGWAITFTRDNERWFAIILDGKVHGQGKGTWLLNKLKEKERKLYGWVVDHDDYKKANGEPYPSPLKFYEKNGFTLCPESRQQTEKLSNVKIAWEQT